MLGAVHLCRALVGGVFLFIASSLLTVAHASFPVSGVNQCRVQSGGGSWSAYFDSCAAAANSIKSLYVGSQVVNCTNVYPNRNTATCTISGFTVGDITYAATSYSCPANSTISGSGSGATCSCNSGFDQVGSGAGATCVPHVNACTSGAGQTRTVNMTIGWARSPTANAKDYVGTIGEVPTASCSGGCRFATLTDVGGYRSTQPSAQGLYRVSTDVLMVQTDTECTTTDDPVNPSAVPATCPGYVGEVNGVTTCVGTVTSPIPPATGTPPETPQQAGNPAAGPAPTSGAGSGVGGFPRTPVDGTGGAGGGPASAAIPHGQSSSGNVSSPGEGQEQQACGAPGQPVCAVKMDENGVPSNVDSQKGIALGQLDTADAARTTILDGIKATGDKNGSWGVTPRWFARADCVPTHLGTWPMGIGEIDINLCPYLGLYNVIASFILCIITFFTVTGMVRDTVIAS